MRIRLGTTRIVLLIGDQAIKIGRLRPLRLLLRLLILPFSRERRRHFLAKYGPGITRAVMQDLCAGLYANRNEYDYSATHRDPRVIPTTKRLWGGWIVIQLRGTPIMVHELPEAPVLRKRIGTQPCEMDKATQFCRHPDGRVVLADYGRITTVTALSETLRRI